MSSAAASYHESAQFIHTRYEDTAHVIFQQQQKKLHEEKQRQKHSNPLQHSKTSSANQHPEFSRFGNHGVVATETVPPTSKSDQSKASKSSKSASKEKDSSLAYVTPAPTGTQTVKSNPDAPDSRRPVRRKRRPPKVVYVTETNV